MPPWQLWRKNRPSYWSLTGLQCPTQKWNKTLLYQLRTQLKQCYKGGVWVFLSFDLYTKTSYTVLWTARFFMRMIARCASLDEFDEFFGHFVVRQVKSSRVIWGIMSVVQIVRDKWLPRCPLGKREDMYLLWMLLSVFQENTELKHLRRD